MISCDRCDGAFFTSQIEFQQHWLAVHAGQPGGPLVVIDGYDYEGVHVGPVLGQMCSTNDNGQRLRIEARWPLESGGFGRSWFDEEFVTDWSPAPRQDLAALEAWLAE